jgi:hypothetical protein
MKTKKEYRDNGTFFRYFANSKDFGFNFEIEKSLYRDKEYKIERYIKDFEKKAIAYFTQIKNLIKTTTLPNIIRIDVNWYIKSAYGWQASCEAWTGGEYLKGNKTGGGGYDKESTAIANALNNSLSLRVALWQELKGEKHYGFGNYGNKRIPSFHGGVGTNCFLNMFEVLGYKVQSISTKYSNVYILEKN